jgi:16S rRNA pseudouridine516 synthase
MMMRLDRILQSQGFGTRRECRSLIEQEAVVIQDIVITDYEAEFETQGLEFTLCDVVCLYREKVYIALNKPSGYECSRNPSHHPGILSLLPDECAQRDVQPIGRLDHDTTGLLLLSDDGAFIHAQSSPRRHVPKTYVATTAAPVTPELVAALQKGVQLNDEPAPLAARSCRQLGAQEVEIVLDQGKYHQVKRMLAAAGNACVALRRTVIGGLTLESLALAAGEWRYLETEHLAQLSSVVKSNT